MTYRCVHLDPFGSLGIKLKAIHGHDEVERQSAQHCKLENVGE